MILTIDVGNTNIKIAVFEDFNLIDKFVFNKTELNKIIKIILKKHSNCSVAVLSSVGKLDQNAVLELKKQIKVVEMDRDFNFPFQNLYETPGTLGIDRMVLAAGAVLIYPKQHVLIIDAGTCVTYDYVTNCAKYLGGAISPGLRLRYESLHNFTANLPLLEKSIPNSYIGTTTSGAIHSGVMLGLCKEIEGFVAEYSAINKEFIIILTGGDANFLANRLKSTIFADENFLLKSLQQLYTYSLQND